jgi:hypothetical protein
MITTAAKVVAYVALDLFHDLLDDLIDRAKEVCDAVIAGLIRWEGVR